MKKYTKKLSIFFLSAIVVGFCPNVAAIYWAGVWDDVWFDRSLTEKMEVVSAVALPTVVVAQGIVDGLKASEKTKNIARAVTSFAYAANSALALYNHEGRARGYNFFRLAVHGYDFYKYFKAAKNAKPDEKVAEVNIEPKKDEKNKNGKKPWHPPSNILLGQGVGSSLISGVKGFIYVTEAYIALTLSCGAWAMDITRVEINPYSSLNDRDNWHKVFDGGKISTTGEGSSWLSLLLCIRKTFFEEKDTKKRIAWGLVAGVNGFLVNQESVWRANAAKKAYADLDPQVDAWTENCKRRWQAEEAQRRSQWEGRNATNDFFEEFFRQQRGFFKRRGGFGGSGNGFGRGGGSRVETEAEEEARMKQAQDAAYEAEERRRAQEAFNQSSPYAELGLPQGADFETQVKVKYRELALKYHPDKQIGKADEEKAAAAEKFKRIQAAYEVLTPKKK